MKRTLSFFLMVMVAWSQCSPIASAQPQAPLYEECRLDSVFPAGGQRGTSVDIELRGFGSGMTLPKRLVLDGPRGVTIKSVMPVNGSTMKATLDIAADAPLGRRWLRVLNERSGLTNFAYFVVSGLPEPLDAEPNNDRLKAQPVTTPCVVNGRIDPAADLDVYRCVGKAGQKFVAAIAAHALDIHGQYKSYGIADFSLELLDAEGRTLASAEDTLGFDPLIEHTLPADGDYLVRVQLLNYGGFPEAVYRLTLGEVPYVIGAFPPGRQRGATAEVELFGPNVPAGTRVRLGASPSADPVDPAYPLQFVGLPAVDTSGLDLPLHIGDQPEVVESEPNDARDATTSLTWPITVNGHFDTSGDVDWYCLPVTQGQPVWIETHAHRFVRAPVDTLLQVFDASGAQLIENDDEAFEPGYESYHDFKTTDSRLIFTPPATGNVFIKVTDQTGSCGPRAMYRLTVRPAEPDFRLSHFPDAVPVWGPGSTAAVLVRIDRLADCKDDIEVAIEGLPAGWKTRSATSLGPTPQRPFNTYQLKVFLSLTAPADAVPGTCVPFRIIGRSKRADGTLVERPSLPLTLFYTSDTGFFRASPVSRAAVAKPQGPWLETSVTELTLPVGGSTSIPVKILKAGDAKEMPITVSLATAGVACGLATPQNLPNRDGMVDVPLKLPPELPPGTYGITVAQTWRNDIRIGMPGPCTPLITVTVTAP